MRSGDHRGPSFRSANLFNSISEHGPNRRNPFVKRVYLSVSRDLCLLCPLLGSAIPLSHILAAGPFYPGGTDGTICWEGRSGISQLRFSTEIRQWIFQSRTPRLFCVWGIDWGGGSDKQATMVISTLTRAPVLPYSLLNGTSLYYSKNCRRYKMKLSLLITSHCDP